MPELSGKSIIGFRRGESDRISFHAINPATGESLQPAYHCASSEEVDAAARLAGEAFETYGCATGKQKAILLRTIAAKIESLGDELIARAMQETALPHARIKNETARTCNQLRLFAELVEEGAIFRFTRAICYQDFVDAALPDELKDANPMNIWRMVDGQITRA